MGRGRSTFAWMASLRSQWRRLRDKIANAR
jgi:hypothetical protein